MRMIMDFRLVRRVLMLMTAVLPSVAVVVHMGIVYMGMFMGMLVQMLMCVRMVMLMQVNHFLVLVFMTVTFPMSVLG
jgi:hypothetical protein